MPSLNDSDVLKCYDLFLFGYFRLWAVRNFTARKQKSLYISVLEKIVFSQSGGMGPLLSPRIGQCSRSVFSKEIFAYGQPTARKQKFLLFIKFNKSNLHHQIAMPISHFTTTNMQWTLQGIYFRLRAVKIFTARKRKFLHRYTIPETKSFYKNW